MGWSGWGTCQARWEEAVAPAGAQDAGVALPLSISPIPDPAPVLVCFQASLVLCLAADSFAYVPCVLTHHRCYELAPPECSFSVYLETAKTCTAVPWEDLEMQVPEPFC